MTESQQASWASGMALKRRMENLPGCVALNGEWWEFHSYIGDVQVYLCCTAEECVNKAYAKYGLEAT